LEQKEIDMRVKTLSLLYTSLFVGMPLQVSFAAPQILAVLTSEDGVSLASAGGICKSDLSSFCLQRERPAPEYDAKYLPGAPGQFTLVVTDLSGIERRFPASRFLTFSEGRGFTAVSAHMPAGRFARLGAVQARLEIGANASLVPLAVEGDKHLQTPDEIPQATGPSRVMGARVVDASPGGKAVRILGTIVNALPREGQEDSSEYEALWTRAKGRRRNNLVNKSGLDRARQAFDQCLNSIKYQATYGMRGCLTTHHDKMMRDLNVKYWNSGAGSRARYWTPGRYLKGARYSNDQSAVTAQITRDRLF
jgi:hypothetical protein